MKTLYLDLSMGAAGDMLNAALYELLGATEQKAEYITLMNALGLDGVTVTPEKIVKNGITGTKMSVKIDGVAEESHDHHGHDHGDGHAHSYDHHEHHHRGMKEIEQIVKAMPVSDKVKTDVMNVYKIIAAAESAVHGRPVTEIHFHEVGMLDAIADIAGVCILMEKIAVERVVASPIHVGSGQVKAAHGILPVPAPATALILKDVPIYGGNIKGELCTPTGAALLKYFVNKFGDMPVMRVAKTGYGMGTKDFDALNCVRIMLGETDEKGTDVVELSCNLDDMTPERIAFCTERLFEAGALDVYTVPVVMKKSRLGTMLCVMCDAKQREDMIRLIFKYTSTLGVRENISHRYTLNRKINMVNTPYGELRVKQSEGFGVQRAKYEYEDLARVARGISESIDKVEKNL
ncbi:MAG: nickel pincer cofactor biosynthesis protein LarC [Lachnospiraceae bacterium]|nr:nickel pincer cofactor biosynthesis protein LarC [Lachnospiraceae bacterium]